MKIKKYLTYACIITLIALGLYYFFKDESSIPKPQEQETNSVSSNLSYIGNTISEERDGKKIWELTAEFIEVDTNTKNVHMKNVKGIFYQETGGKVELTAPEANMDNNTKDVVMTGKVTAVASDGASFTANETRWASNEQRFFGSGDIVLKRDDTTITGDKIESDANIEKVRIQGSAKVRKGGASN